MKAIFKREFNSYFTSMLGYVYLAIFLLLTGIMFYLVNIGYMMASMTGFFSSVIDVAIFFLPLLTMRLFSEERKHKTDQLLLTAPVSTWEIVLGKFFAALGVFLVGMAITLIYPVMLAIWGNLPLAETINCYLGFILLCSVILAIGAFMSSITESQIVAAVSTYGIIILTMLIGRVSTFVSNETLVRALMWLSPVSRFSDFTLGILNFEPVIYYVSLTALFLFFTWAVFERRKTARSTSLLTIAAIVIVILVNVLVSVIGSKVPLKADFTSNKMFALSKETKEFLKDYDTETDIYILASEADQDTRISSALSQYEANGKNIKVTNINTAENPTFGKKYVENGGSLAANSVIVDAGERYKVIGMTELYGLDAKSGKYTSLNVENKINSALKYVASTEQLTAYFVSGHGELEVQGVANKLISENYNVKMWNSLTEDVPADASVVMIVRPTSDLSAAEITKLDEYLLSGGSVQAYFDVDSNNLTNLYGYLTSWGITVNDDVVVETDKSKMVALGQSGMALFVPEINETEFTKSIIENKRTIAYFPYSKSLTLPFEANGQIAVTPILESSDKSYTGTVESVEKTDASKEGKFIVGALSQDNAHSSSVYVSGNTFLLTRDPSVLANDYGLANYDYLMNVINYTQGAENTFTVGEKALVSNVISITQLTAVIAFAFVVVIIPLIILIAGLIVWIKRRNL